MCNVAAETCIINGFGQQCTIINKDVRLLTAEESKDGAADLPRRADICIFEVLTIELILCCCWLCSWLCKVAPFYFVSFQVFDCGLIGEGVLHMLQHAHAHLLQADSALVNTCEKGSMQSISALNFVMHTSHRHSMFASKVPMAAEVWCQPIQMTFKDVNGIDMSACNAWQWRPDYEEIDLLSCRYSNWVHTLSPGSLATIVTTLLCL